jgi:hypothetical protein
VDAWIECGGAIVTIDVTKNPEKKSTQADVLFRITNGKVDFYMEVHRALESARVRANHAQLVHRRRTSKC